MAALSVSLGQKRSPSTSACIKKEDWKQASTSQASRLQALAPAPTHCRSPKLPSAGDGRSAPLGHCAL
ncbi:uncharacterized protein THITE_2117964 [Thermothielavioides terrestris NRRL 8126]|uniref:Uncharacterized protein n=1 Tax=Thermothielavioides terrestris (strain ATCC 38088 / NRRL 8126) TaxID=578455 RepID=G2R697_THETT|nr:uncharacterized protein THITE_2117964 [Thermothielavioides terrestris NRRL 8126]AEO68430.1 hypothetical protein THITE_2117964 [Thermothielavioides terrestris NRRL 8126]